MGDSAFEHRLATLGDAMAQSRRCWRSLYGRFWQLRHENTIRRPSWRVEMETQAWKAMRAEVRRYGELRAQRRELKNQFPLRQIAAEWAATRNQSSNDTSRDSAAAPKVPPGMTGNP